MDTRRLRDALERLAGTGEVPRVVRPEIAESWTRSLNHGLHPEHFAVPFIADPDAETATARNARKVLQRLAEDLEGTDVGVLLTNSAGQVVARWASGRRVREDLDNISLAPGFDYGETFAGTNAIGAAVQRRTPTFVMGEEHFSEALTGMACGAAPFFDPSTGRLLGIVDLTCRATEANPLLLTLALRAAREVSERLSHGLYPEDRILWDRFLEVKRGAKGAVVVMNEQRILRNGAADHLVRTADGPLLWEHAAQALAQSSSGSARLRLASGVEVGVTCEPVWDGTDLIGAVLRLRSEQDHRRGEVLTSTEQSVASLVVAGLTNRQVGEKLFISRYTVDSHLRAIYRKLGVASRVELANAMSGPSARAADDGRP